MNNASWRNMGKCIYCSLHSKDYLFLLITDKSNTFDFRCMIIDTNGMVILHEDFIQNPRKGRMSQQHIINKVKQYPLSPCYFQKEYLIFSKTFFSLFRIPTLLVSCTKKEL